VTACCDEAAGVLACGSSEMQVDGGRMKSVRSAGAFARTVRRGGDESGLVEATFRNRDIKGRRRDHDRACLVAARKVIILARLHVVERRC
jgi:hypothetical protein